MKTRYAENNYAFIDGFNLHATYQNMPWKLDYNKLIIWLARKHNVTLAYYFIGFIPQNKETYTKLEQYGYTLKHRDTAVRTITCPNCAYIFMPRKGRTKSDCDADITLQVLDDGNNYDRAILVTSDGDFDNLVRKLLQENKLSLVLAPCRHGCSSLLKRAARGRIDFLDEHRSKLEMK